MVGSRMRKRQVADIGIPADAVSLHRLDQGIHAAGGVCWIIRALAPAFLIEVQSGSWMKTTMAGSTTFTAEIAKNAKSLGG